jgi:uncharacterized repeat protein (TIGR04076 family)
MSKIVVTVVEGKCQGGNHRIGDKWEFEWLTPQGICLGAWGAIFPYVMALNYGGGISWTDGPLKEKIHCPDPKGVVLEVEKIKGS